MKRHILLVLLLSAGLCQSGCTGQSVQPDVSSTVEENDAPQATGSEKPAEMSTKEMTRLETTPKFNEYP